MPAFQRENKRELFSCEKPLWIKSLLSSAVSEDCFHHKSAREQFLDCAGFFPRTPPPFFSIFGMTDGWYGWLSTWVGFCVLVYVHVRGVRVTTRVCARMRVCVNYKWWITLDLPFQWVAAALLTSCPVQIFVASPSSSDWQCFSKPIFRLRKSMHALTLKVTGLNLFRFSVRLTRWVQSRWR